MSWNDKNSKIEKDNSKTEYIPSGNETVINKFLISFLCQVRDCSTISKKDRFQAANPIGI